MSLSPDVSVQKPRYAGVDLNLYWIVRDGWPKFGVISENASLYAEEFRYLFRINICKRV